MLNKRRQDNFGLKGTSHVHSSLSWVCILSKAPKVSVLVGTETFYVLLVPLFDKISIQPHCLITWPSLEGHSWPGFPWKSKRCVAEARPHEACAGHSGVWCSPTDPMAFCAPCLLQFPWVDIRNHWHLNRWLRGTCRNPSTASICQLLLVKTGFFPCMSLSYITWITAGGPAPLWGTGMSTRTRRPLAATQREFQHQVTNTEPTPHLTCAGTMSDTNICIQRLYTAPFS